MNNFNNYVDIDKINSQLARAEVKKIRLVRNVYREYEIYLNLVRELLYISVEKGLNELFNYLSIKKNFINSNDIFCLLEKKISKLIYTNLPFLTVEQLKINEIDKNINTEINFNSLGVSLKTNHEKKEKEFQYEDVFKFKKSIQFQTSDEFLNTSDYYQADNFEKFASLDLDNNYHKKYLSKNNIIEDIGEEKQFISSLLELIEEDKDKNQRYSEKDNVNKMNISSNHHNLKNFDLIDNSLENLLLNLSYKINKELFNANLIKKMITKHSFKYLVGKKLMIKHPHPFVISFDFNLNQSSSKVDNYPSISFFNLSTVELEFENLNLSIQRNKINKVKNEFQRLIKKETYWRQKEITLNKIR